MSAVTRRAIQEPWFGWIVGVMYNTETSKIDIPESPLIRKCRGRSQASTTDLINLLEIFHFPNSSTTPVVIYNQSCWKAAIHEEKDSSWHELLL